MSAFVEQSALRVGSLLLGLKLHRRLSFEYKKKIKILKVVNQLSKSVLTALQKEVSAGTCNVGDAETAARFFRGPTC